MIVGKSLPAKIFIFFICILPFIIWNGFYEGPKVFLFLIIGLFLTLFWIYRILFLKKDFLLTKKDLFFIMWLLVLIISSLIGRDPAGSVIGTGYRHQGIIFFAALWLTLKTVELLNTNNRKLLDKFLGAAVLVESLIVFFQFASGQLYFGKPLGTLGEANSVAGFLAIGSYFFFKNFDSLYFAFTITAILITESRAGLFGLLPNLFYIFRNFNKRFRQVVLLVIVAASVAFVSILSLQRGTSVFENRQKIWQIGTGAVLQKPFLGYGAESEIDIFKNGYINALIPLNSLIIDRAHNLFIDVALWSGLIGLIFFTGFLFCFYKELKDNYKKFAFISFLIYSFFQPLSIVHWLLLILL